MDLEDVLGEVETDRCWLHGMTPVVVALDAHQLRISPVSGKRAPSTPSILNKSSGNPHIDDLMSKEAAAADAKNIRAASNLQTLKDALDGVIEQAAPGFGQYLQNFSEASRPIDTMQASRASRTSCTTPKAGCNCRGCNR